MFMPCTRVYLSGIQLGKHQLLGEAQAVVAVAVERVRDSSRGSRARAAGRAKSTGPGTRTSACRGGASPCSRSQPSRSRKAAMLFLALQRTGFWPVISRQGRGGLFHVLLVGDRAADAHVDDDLLEPRQGEPIVAAQLFLAAAERSALRTAFATAESAAGAGLLFGFFFFLGHAFDSHGTLTRRSYFCSSLRCFGGSWRFAVAAAECGFLRRGDLAGARVALLAVSFLAAVVEEASTECAPRCRTTGRTYFTFES